MYLMSDQNRSVYKNMSNPYESPRARGRGTSVPKRNRGCLKHCFIFLALFLMVNFNRFFGSLSEVDGEPKVSLLGSFLGLLFFYGIGYFVFSRGRSRK